ncbi:MAG: CBS domain-containing protein [Candidatus Omnitrophica bacterium]|nr:CBS domain-containing protein [Candidatus Omnitrophota bacterium]
MFGKRITLFKLFGFDVKIDTSWFFIALLVVWSLAQGFFPYSYGGLSERTYWLMGVAGALGLFCSIVIHEFFHSLVARRFGLPMKGITLFIFGGVAEMPEEPPTARAEFFMAAAGPAVSIVLGFLFLLLVRAGSSAGWYRPAVGVMKYLTYINWALAAFNLLPAFPLDGGRILRSILWKVKHDLRWATRISARIGAGFGILLIATGVLFLFLGGFIGGFWWILIGIFLRNASHMSYQRLLMKQAFHGEPVRNFMKKDPVTVAENVTLSDFVDNYIYRYHYKMFPVVEDGRLKGCVHASDVKKIGRQDWDKKSVKDAARPCGPENTLTPDTDAMDALSLMHKNHRSRMLVEEKGQAVGVLSLKDLLKFLSLKIDLEG